MTTRYVRSSDGNNSDNGSTWALAKATTLGAISGLTAGDHTIYLSQAHSETVASDTQITGPTAFGSQMKVLCANDSANPPTALAETAVIQTTGTGSLFVNTSADSGGGYMYFYGIVFKTGVGGSTGAPHLIVGGGGNVHTRMKNCTFKIESTSSVPPRLIIGNTKGNGTLENCQFSLGHTSQKLETGGNWRFHGGSLMAGSATPAGAMFLNQRGIFTAIGFDMTQASSTVNLINLNDGSRTLPCYSKLIGCTLPSSWSGNLVSSTPGGHNFAEMIHCTTVDGVEYPYWKETQFGAVKHRSDVTHDGGSPFSWALISSTECSHAYAAVESQEIYVLCETAGSPVTVTIQVATNGVTLNDGDLAIEAYYPDSALPLARISSEKATFLTSATNLTTSSESWTGVPGSPVKQEVEVTFTPSSVGIAILRVYLYRASTTVYIDPEPVLS